MASIPAPNKIPWPPLIYLGAAAAGLALHWTVPLPWPTGALGAVLMVLGLFMLAAAIAIELATALTFRRHKTTILPHRAATRLITSGPFAWSRNPIYLANTMLLIGVGLAFGIGWLVLTAPFAAGLTLLLAIKREERHLAQQFGDDWKAYAARTGRWFGKH
jgi:protein-S-isoprenylcysteine O-methyltransferase Ste14